MIVKIAASNAELEKIIDLRDEVLRKPWRQPRHTATDELEFESVNAYIDIENTIVACARLQNNGNDIGQIRFMAVAESQQGKGLGKMIVEALEQEAKTQGIKLIQLQARENAIEFYKACGYTTKQKTFLMWDLIQHYLMEKEL